MRNVVPIRRSKIEEDDISVIILAGNAGYRMKSYGTRSLLKIDSEKTILDNQVEIIRTKFPKSDIIIVTGFETDKIVRNRPSKTRVIENQLYENSNEVEQLRLAFNCIVTNNVLVINGNIIFDYNTIKPIIPDTSSLIVDSKNQLSTENIGITVVDKRATIMAHGIKPIWTNILYLSGKEFKYFKQICCDREKSRMYMFEAINILLKKFQLEVLYPVQMSIFKVDNPKHVGELR